MRRNNFWIAKYGLVTGYYKLNFLFQSGCCRSCIRDIGVCAPFSAGSMGTPSMLGTANTVLLYNGFSLTLGVDARVGEKPLYDKTLLGWSIGKSLKASAGFDFRRENHLYGIQISNF